MKSITVHICDVGGGSNSKGQTLTVGVRQESPRLDGMALVLGASRSQSSSHEGSFLKGAPFYQ